MLFDSDKIDIGERIKESRKNKHLTQFMLAEKVGLHEKQISRIESGQNYPTLQSFFKIIDTLDMDLSDFSKESNTIKSPLKNSLIEIINSANDTELKIYSDILKPLRKNLKNINV